MKVLRIFAIIVVLFAFAPSSVAQECEMYTCKKKGHTESWITADKHKERRRQGYRCRCVIRGSRPTASSNKTGSAKSGTKRARGTRRPTVRRGTASAVFERKHKVKSGKVPKRSGGPAGERKSYESIIQEASDKHNVPVNLIRAVIKVESNFHPRAVSNAGAQGLMQLMPSTARQLGVTDSFDVRQNILAGTYYLRRLFKQFNQDKVKMIAAYHAGPGIVTRRNGIPYKATERYVRRVLTHWARYRAQGL